jgi:uncharacterized protein CbrC (UPF0167 family)
MELPQFKYHPDPLSTGSIVASEQVCEVCGQARGFVYEGPIYSESEPEAVCPWCIADGSAHAKLGAEFVDRDFIGGDGWESVQAEAADEIAFRTPGFSGWQQERWFTHCSDGAEFLGPVGKEQLIKAGGEAVQAIRDESGYEAAGWEEYFDSLNAEHGPATAYLFKCRHCGKLGGYSDCH